MPLHQIQLSLPGDQADNIADLLSNLGALSVTLQDAGDDPIYEPKLHETPLWQMTTIVALFDEQACMEDIQEVIRSNVPPESDCEIAQVGDCDWQAHFRQEFQPIDFGQGLWICPSWHGVPVEAKTVVRLDPGIAFGTGTHPTTFLCLQWLAQHPPVNKHVIDFGCGSGILAIAALKLGAQHCLAMDISEQALESTLSNAIQNDIDQSALTTCLPEKISNQSADLILANILAQPLIENVETFARLMKPSGVLVLSGILEEQIPMILTAFSSYFKQVASFVKEGWVCMQFEGRPKRQ